LGGAAHLRGGGLDVQPTAQGEAQAVVAAQRGGAGGDQVTHPGEPGEGLAAPAQGHAEPRDLGQPAGDQTGGGVVAVPQAGGGADGDRDDVLHGAGDLDPDHVGGGVGPQIGCTAPGGEGVGELLRGRGDDARAGAALGDLGREV